MSQGALLFSLHNRCFMSQARQTCHFAQSTRRGGEKNIKAPVTSPLFWLFPPPNVCPQVLTDSGDVKRTHQSNHNPILDKSHLSGYHQHQQQHKPQEMKTTRAWITFTNVRLSAAKVRFAQSKLSLCPNTVAGKKHVVQTNSKVTFHIIRSLWVVFGLSTLNSKKLVNQAFSKPSWKYNVNPRTS